MFVGAHLDIQRIGIPDRNGAVAHAGGKEQLIGDRQGSGCDLVDALESLLVLEGNLPGEVFSLIFGKLVGGALPEVGNVLIVGDVVGLLGEEVGDAELLGIGPPIDDPLDNLHVLGLLELFLLVQLHSVVQHIDVWPENGRFIWLGVVVPVLKH